MYIFFMLVGITSAPEIDPELSYNVVDYAYQIFFALPRIFIATLIVSLLLLFFEFLGSFFLANEEEKRGKGKSSPWISQFVGIAFTCAIFLLLFLFVFNWVPFGLFLYIFYGTISPLPAIILF
jgi:membrane protein insertase Oxa1/YidC/SpoIIIJ